MDRLLWFVVIFVWLLVGWIGDALKKSREASRRSAPTPVSNGRPEVSRRRDRTRSTYSPDHDKPASSKGATETVKRPDPEPQRKETRRPGTRDSGPKRQVEVMGRKMDANQVLNGIVMAEIIGPPRSVRPHRPPWGRK